MDKNILLGITGGIAAYKMVEVASSLTKMGNNVKVVMTDSAVKFITPMTFRAITHNPVYTDIFDLNTDNNIKHITLAEEADLILLAPATANFIARTAQGMADDLLSTIVMATKAKILLSPAMNVNMLKNPIVQENIQKLKKSGIEVIKPATGYLACGTEGEGRLPEPSVLIEHVISKLTEKTLINKKVLITAGPTREPIDPVRFLSNYSSGKMGYAMAGSAVHRGADVTLISGPTAINPPAGVRTINVETAEEMNKQVSKHIDDFDLIIMVAAVADYRPEKIHKEKIKKENNREFILNLRKNPDILMNIGQNKKEEQLLIGFAAETEHIEDNAREKLKKKNLDMIIANDISKNNTGFASDKNQVYVITEDKIKKLPVMEKTDLADMLFDEIIKL